MQNIELRFTNFDNVSEDNDGKLRVSGYVNEVGKFSHTLGRRKKFKEKIVPGTFAKALQKGNDIHFLAEHDDNKILASTRNGSLTLAEDDKGLFMTAEISPTSYGRDYHTLINDGILRNMSFGFSVDKDKWGKLEDGTYTREISDLTLFEVSVVTNPAYPQSSIQARGMSLVDELEIPSDVCSNIEEVSSTETENDMEEVKVEEVKEEKQEERAYISNIWDDRDLLNHSLSLMADCTTLIQHGLENPDKISAEDLEVLRKCTTICSNIIATFNGTTESQEEVETVDEVRKADKVEEDKESKEEKEPKEEVEEKEDEIREEDSKDEEESKEDDSKEEDSEDDEKVSDDDKEVDEEEEERSIDLSDYYKILENL